MSTVYFYADFKKAKVGTAPAVAPTLDLYRIVRSSGVESAVGTGLTLTASALVGRYFYALAGADLDTYDYHGRASTSDDTLDNQEADVLWTRYGESLIGAQLPAAIAGAAGGLLTLGANAVADAGMSITNNAGIALTLNGVNYGLVLEGGTAGVWYLGTGAGLGIKITGGISGGITPPTAVAISTQVAADLATAHGDGSWLTGAGLDAAGVRSAVGLATASLDTQLGGIKTIADHLATAMEFNSGSYRFTVAALANAPASSGDWSSGERNQIRKALGVTGTVAATTGTGILDLVKFKTDNIGTASVSVTSPVATDGSIEVFRGDGYLNLDGRAIEFTDTGGTWPDLTGGSVVFRIFDGAHVNLTIAATIVVAGGASQKVRAEPTSADTSVRFADRCRFKFLATLASGQPATIVEGGLMGAY